MLSRGVCVGYGGVAFCSALLHNLFLIYHVDIFVMVYRIDRLSFWLGEAAFLVWNSVNDPLFGWLSDRRYLGGGGGAADAGAVVRDRVRALRRAGPWMAAAFLSFWLPWTYAPLQFVVCLCVYDTCLTIVDLHHSALLADLSVDGGARTRLNFYASVGAGVGAASVFLSYATWRRFGFVGFQWYCVAVAVVAAVGFVVSTTQLGATYGTAPELHTDDKEKTALINEVKQPEPELSSEKAQLKTYVKQLAGHGNFFWFAAMNLVQVFHCHFNSNFFPLFLENLLGDSVPQLACSLILGVSFVAPHVNNLYFLGLCTRHGAYAVIRGLFYVKLVLAVFMLLMGHRHIWLLCLFIASNRVFTEGTCRLLSLVISDMVDEDVVIHHRRHALSALMFGSLAFLSKPGQTLAPLVGTLMLSYQTGHDVFRSVDLVGSRQPQFSGAASGAEQYRAAIFQLLVVVPIACATLQLFSWSRFTLHGSRLRWIKELRSPAQYMHAV